MLGISLFMNISTLVNGVNSVSDRFSLAFLNSALRPPKRVAEEYFRKQELWLDIDLSDADYGRKWQALFDKVRSTDSHVTLFVQKKQLLTDLSPDRLSKKWYLLPAVRWNPNRRPMLGVREAAKRRLNWYDLGRVHGLEDTIVGVDFQGIGKDGMLRVWSDYDSIRANAMYLAWKDVADVKVRLGSNPLSEGIIIEVKGIPSVGQGDPNDVVVHKVAVYAEPAGLTDHARVLSYGLLTSDECERRTFGLESFYRMKNPAFGSDRRTLPELDIDMHTMFALKAGSDAVERQGLTMYSPIPDYPQALETLVDACAQRVVVVDNTGMDVLGSRVGWMKMTAQMARAYLNTKQRNLL